MVRVFGSNFSRRANICCKVGEMPSVAASFVNSTAVDCPVANVPTGLHKFGVSSNCMDFVSGESLLEVTEPRALLGIHPVSGPSHGGTNVIALVRAQDGSPDVQDAGVEAFCRFGCIDPGIVCHVCPFGADQEH